MIRTIIKIDEEKCVGCGLCAKACHEGAIEMIDGKAKLVRDDYCDGMGDCLPDCPTGAISFEEREAAAYDESAVMSHKRKKEKKGIKSFASMFKKCDKEECQNEENANNVCNCEQTRLSNWPVQIKLAPITSDFYNGCDLLIAADCTAFSYKNFHEDFIKNHTTLIACPKLDAVDYSEKLAAILMANDIKSIKLARMTVPCCGGLKVAVEKAIEKSGKNIPFEIVVISTTGEIV